ncbi:hypothetical protein ACFYVL_04320 [Streptomyces sp. NPDC004111]|uniref:hypothetical protein n=1 Tax=Streptomyces sp. NPDC004111 TaxID=3364690 RepID=UPI00367E2909
MDFEPWEDGVAFEIAADARLPDDPGTVPGYLAALETGLREELAAVGAARGVRVAVAVVVRGIRIHEVDSRDRSFREAGRVAVRNAVHRLYGPPPRPKRKA